MDAIITYHHVVQRGSSMTMPGIPVLRVATVALLASALQLTAVPALSKTDIHSFDFRNTDYPSGCSALIEDPRFGDIIHVKDGEWKDRTGNEEIYFSVDKISYGDLDGDGRDEAVVETSCAPTGANYSETEVYTFRLSNNQPKLMQRLSRVDWTGSETAWQVTAIKVVRHGIRVSYFAGGNHARPAWVMTAKFRWKDDRFVRTGIDRKVLK